LDKNKLLLKLLRDLWELRLATIDVAGSDSKYWQGMIDATCNILDGIDHLQEESFSPANIQHLEWQPTSTSDTADGVGKRNGWLRRMMKVIDYIDNGDDNEYWEELFMLEKIEHPEYETPVIIRK
jgi:hypothetical protein